MKFNLSSLFLTVTALASASGSIAQSTTTTDTAPPAITEVPGSSGCAQDTCWASCIPYDDQGNRINEPDPSTAWTEGGNWCWLVQAQWWAGCRQGCTANKEIMTCDDKDPNSCSPHDD